MAVHLSEPDRASLYPIAGLHIGVAEAGIRKKDKKDLTIFLIEPESQVAAVLTQNRFSAAPVQICREHLVIGQDIRALVINTGNANAGTGQEGLRRARNICQALASKLRIKSNQILPFSTGVIMEQLPDDRIISGLDAALLNANPNNWINAAQGIMTTDTLPKAFGTQVKIDGVTVSITGISKGAGMIRPDMATMLGFIATDAQIAPTLIQQLLQELADGSFNRISIDGDTSTNDSFVLIATQKANHVQINDLQTPQGQTLRAGLMFVAQQLAQAIVRDGEGATKFITIEVSGGRSQAECRQVAYAVAHSPLVKTAFFASDPNLGRILAAVGYAGIMDLDQACIELYLDDVHVVTKGGRNPAYIEEQGQKIMQKSEIHVRINLGRGDYADTIWTCDLSHDYVSINADYRS